MVQKLALYTALCLIKGHFLKGIVGMLVVLCAFAFFCGSTLLLESNTASQHFFTFSLTPCLFFALGQSMLMTVFHQHETNEQTYFLVRGLNPLSYGVGLLEGYTLILLMVCCGAPLLLTGLLNASWESSLSWGFKLFCQGTGILWLSFLLGYASKTLSQGTLCLGLILVLSWLKNSLLATVSNPFSLTIETKAPFVEILQKLSLILPPFTLEMTGFSWQDGLHLVILLFIFTLLSFTTSWRKGSILGTSLLLLIFLQEPPVSLSQKDAGQIPYPAPTSQQRDFLKALNAPFFGYVFLLYLHHAGDLDGKRVPLRTYDYKRVTKWLSTAHTLVPHSELPPFLGLFYFGMTPDIVQRQHLTHELPSFVGMNAQKELWISLGTLLQK